MDEILKVPDTYNIDSVKTHRIFPLIDLKIESLLKKIYDSGIDSGPFLDDKIPNLNEKYSKNISDEFKFNFENSIKSSKLNCLTGFDSFTRIDLCLGCTQYIDNLYVMNGSDRIQVLEKEYTYHGYLNDKLVPSYAGKLSSSKILILSAPFTTGSLREDFNDILEECLKKKIDLHIDGAWITSAKNINIDLSHPAIKSFAVSMSKGYGLSGWNRIGLRWTKEVKTDTITIMNDYNQIPSFPVIIGNQFLKEIPPDHLWNTHYHAYEKIAKDFNLTKTDSIHVMLEDNWIRGVAPLIRFLERKK